MGHFRASQVVAGLEVEHPIFDYGVGTVLRVVHGPHNGQIKGCNAVVQFPAVNVVLWLKSVELKKPGTKRKWRVGE